MELHHLRCAVALAEHLSFTRAAATLYITQPSLSYVIRKLEAELGTAVFVRQPRGVQITPAGEAFLVAARRALEHAERSRGAVGAVKSLAAGELDVVATPPAITLVSRRVIDFHRRHPGVFVTVHHAADDRRIVEMVRAGHAELGVVRAPHVTDDVDSVALGTIEMVAVLPERWFHRPPPGTPLSVRDLADRPLIGPLPETLEHDVFLGYFTSTGVQPQIVAECNLDVTALELVRLGIGATVSPAPRLTQLDTTGLAIHPLVPVHHVDISLVHRRGPLSPAAVAFLEASAGEAPTGEAPTGETSAGNTSAGDTSGPAAAPALSRGS